MVEPVSVQPRPGYRIWIEFSDGVSGEIDLSGIAGQGVFAAWNEPGFFEKVHISEHRAIAWNEDLELCPDSLYLEVTGKSFEDLWGKVEAPSHDA